MEICKGNWRTCSSVTVHTLTFQNSQEARRPTIHAVCSTVCCGNGYKCQYNRFVVMVGSARTTVWVATRVTSQLGLWRDWLGQATGDLTKLSNWKSDVCVRVFHKIHLSSSLINSTHRVESWCLAETGDLLCEGAKQQSAVTFAGPKGRGSQCRRYSWWRVEVQCVVHTSSCWWKDISHKVRPCIIVIG